MIQHIIESVDKLFEADIPTLQGKLELRDDTWARLQQLAQTKGMELNNIALKTTTGKTLVTMQDADPWSAITEYLELEDIKDSPPRALQPFNIDKAIKNPQANLKKITIVGKMGDELPNQDELRQILAANLKPIKVDVESVTVTKEAANVTILVTATADATAKDDDIKKIIQTNVDKILPITNIII